MDEIRNAAVVHFNGNMKPWLDIAMNQFRPLWTKYVDYDLEFVQACNFGLWIMILMVEVSLSKEFAYTGPIASIMSLVLLLFIYTLTKSLFCTQEKLLSTQV